MPLPRFHPLRERGAPAAGGGPGPRPPTLHGHRHGHGERVRPQQLGLGGRVALHRRQTPQAETVQADLREEDGEEQEPEGGREGQRQC